MKISQQSWLNLERRILGLYKNLKLPVLGEINTQGKFGFLIEVKEGIPGLMIFDTLSSEQIQSLQFIIISITAILYL